MTGLATDWTTLIPPLRFVAFTFVTASGLATLEVAANSYISVLGPPKTAAFRLVLAQSFNVSGTCLCHTGCEIDTHVGLAQGIASVIGPLIASKAFFVSCQRSAPLMRFATDPVVNSVSTERTQTLLERYVMRSITIASGV